MEYPLKDVPTPTAEQVKAAEELLRTADYQGYTKQ